MCVLYQARTRTARARNSNLLSQQVGLNALEEQYALMTDSSSQCERHCRIIYYRSGPGSWQHREMCMTHFLGLSCPATALAACQLLFLVPPRHIRTALRHEWGRLPVPRHILHSVRRASLTDRRAAVETLMDLGKCCRIPALK